MAVNAVSLDVPGRLVWPGRAVAQTVRELPGPAVVFAVGVGSMLAWNGADGSERWQAYLLLFAFFVPLFCVVHQLARFDRLVVWGIVSLAVLHAAGGLAPSPTQGANVFYETWIWEPVLKVDRLIHAWGGGVLVLLGWHFVGMVMRSGAPIWVMTALSIMVANGFGALNEVAEFFVDGQVPESVVGSYRNSSWDMVHNLIGALVAGGIVASVEHRRRRGASPGDEAHSDASKASR
ncbi:MAG TPA: hypothetical protein VGA36_03120 [Nitriliruptorales bacterium]